MINVATLGDEDSGSDDELIQFGSFSIEETIKVKESIPRARKTPQREPAADDDHEGEKDDDTATTKEPEKAVTSQPTSPAPGPTTPAPKKVSSFVLNDTHCKEY